MKRVTLVSLVLVLCAAQLLFSQESRSDHAQVIPPIARRAQPPSPNASVEDLEMRGDVLRSEKFFLDALDYYEAALKKSPQNEILYNKAGMCELLVGHYHDARKEFERAIHYNHHFADAYNNLGVIYYTQKNYGKAVKEYKNAIRNNPNSASFYSNLGTAYFSKKDWKKASAAYTTAVHLDPNIFLQSSLSGVVAQMSSPEDRARFQFSLAKIYAKNGNMNDALFYLRRAIEGGYKQINDVYKDPEFATLRKDPRFTELMSHKPTALPE
jgi:tetratricopeptide (TPR) repeat protein